MIELSELEAPDGRVASALRAIPATRRSTCTSFGQDGPPCTYATALGQDSLSSRMIHTLCEEGI
jgi:sugar/nucleoside kinase (ribokinase family)